VDLVAFVQKEVGEVGSVLAGDASDECFFHRFTIDRENAWW
jgi:hypothetical protein